MSIDAHAVARLEVVDQVEDLRLHRHVEGSGRLVGYQHVGAVGQRHGDHHALALAAGELVGVLPEAGVGVGDLDFLEEVARADHRLGAAEPLVQAEPSQIWLPMV